MPMHPHIELGLKLAIGMAVLRGLPFAVYAVFSARTGLRGKLVVLAAFSVFTAAFLAVEPRADVHVGLIVGGSIYFFAASTVVYWIAQLMRFAVPSLVQFVLCVCVFLLVPMLATDGTYAALLYVSGWELAFSASSLMAEMRRHEPTWKESILFLLVNPTLLFTRRGEAVATPALHRRGLVRIGLGMAAVAASGILKPVAHQVRSHAQRTEWMYDGIDGYMAVIGTGITLFLATYATASGLASFQIGCMHCLGWKLPERYRLPIFATSFSDFWRRWNCYHGVWLERYVFRPVTLRAARRYGRGWGRVLGVLAAFSFIGITHDLYTYVEMGRVQFLATCFFLFNAVAVLVEQGARHVWLQRQPASASDSVRQLAWFGFVHVWCAVLAVSLWIGHSP